MNWTLTWYHPGAGKTMQKIADEYADLILTGLSK